MRQPLAWLYQSLSNRGLIVGSSGNVSARTPDGMMITPSGGDPESVTEADLVEVTLDGDVVGDGGLMSKEVFATSSGATPSSEWAMHAAVYLECPDAGFVVHTHADACTALACLGSGLPPFHYMVVQFGGADVRCASYVTFGTPLLARYAAEAIRGRSACLLGNHGMIVCAATAEGVLSRAVLLETLCRQYLLALAAGTPRLLTKREILDAQERFRTYGRRDPNG